jgi:hypothetical protein
MITVKRGDTHPITLTVAGDDVVDLTGATVKMFARRSTAQAIPLEVTATGPNTLTHTLTGTLQPGMYRLEVEITRDGVVRTAPTSGYLQLDVQADLG